MQIHRIGEMKDMGVKAVQNMGKEVISTPIFFNSNAQFGHIVLAVVHPTDDDTMLTKSLEFDSNGVPICIWVVPDGPFSEHVREYLNFHGYDIIG